jgi:NAD(P)-dependent dehydrogenase (short-subunit alcohol dehydrogenase family)
MGAETARRLADEGAKVVVGDINVEGAGQVAASIEEAGGSAAVAEFDLGDEASIEAMMHKAVDVFGGIDGLHANAADLSDQTIMADTDAVEIDIEVFDRIIRTDLRGYLFCCRHAIPLLLERGGGAIVLTSSDGSLNAQPSRVAYCAAKSGVNSLVRHISARWGKEGIRCNAVSPGLIQSETALRQLTPRFREAAMGRAHSPRLGEPSDIAGCVAYLLSDDAGWVTGQVISVNGGLVVR